LTDEVDFIYYLIKNYQTLVQIVKYNYIQHLVVWIKQSLVVQLGNQIRFEKSIAWKAELDHTFRHPLEFIINNTKNLVVITLFQRWE